LAPSIKLALFKALNQRTTSNSQQPTATTQVAQSTTEAINGSLLLTPSSSKLATVFFLFLLFIETVKTTKTTKKQRTTVQ